jgi:hypothetical protein
MTRVWVASKVEETVVWLKSEDTSGSLFTSRMPLSGPLAAAVIRR